MLGCGNARKSGQMPSHTQDTAQCKLRFRKSFPEFLRERHPARARIAGGPKGRVRSSRASEAHLIVRVIYLPTFARGRGGLLSSEQWAINFFSFFFFCSTVYFNPQSRNFANPTTLSRAWRLVGSLEFSLGGLRFRLVVLDGSSFMEQKNHSGLIRPHGQSKERARPGSTGTPSGRRSEAG